MQQLQGRNGILTGGTRGIGLIQRAEETLGPIDILVNNALSPALGNVMLKRRGVVDLFQTE